MTLGEFILATLIYHDIFDYPLNLQEIRQFLVGKSASAKLVDQQLKKLIDKGKINSLDSYYFLRGRSKLVRIRTSRQKYSKQKMKKARFLAGILKFVPTLKLVAISGALAMENSHKNDDIDLVLVTAKKRLWTTRFLANFLLLPFKRSPSNKKFSNRACLNVFIDESNLQIAPKNIYLAHEICQMKPLWDRDGIYKRFIDANKWVKNFLPNWQPGSWFMVHGSRKARLSTVNCQLSTVENLLRNFQLWYMRPKITTEKIGNTQLFFHPAKTGEWVIDEYYKRLKKLRLTLAS